MGRSVAFAPLETPIGRLWVATSQVGVLAITAGDGPMQLLRELERLAPDADASLDGTRLTPVLEQLRAYLSGDLRELALRIDAGGARAFDRAVWIEVRAIPYGATASYGDVGAAVGSPRAARAVGGALARCPLSPVVPCHRVIHADGTIGGWGSDLTTKRWLLDLEQGGSEGIGVRH